MRKIALAALLALAVSPACAQDAKLTVTKQAWQGFEAYKAWIGDIGAGYFAVSRDGSSGWAGSGCQVDGCDLTGMKEQAIETCQKYSGGVPCLIFARNHDPVVPYDIAH